VLLYLVLVFACLGGCTIGEPLARSQDSAAGVEALRRDLLIALDGVLRETMAPGATASVVLPDGTAVAVAAGVADTASGTAMTPQTQMLGGSTGKSFVGALALRLSRESVFDLDQPIATWLGDEPWFHRLPNARDITIAHLANHRAGLPDHLYLPTYHEALLSGDFVPSEHLQPLDFVDFILDETPLSAAGDAYHYSDTGFLLLGMVIEKATGRAYYDLVHEAFLEPLALKHTSPSNTRDLPRLATGYFDDDITRTLLGTDTTRLESGLLAFNPVVEWTGGGFATTAKDLAAWGSALYEGRAMPGAYVDELLGPLAASLAIGESTYHLGQGIRRTPQGLVCGHNGWIPGYVSYFAYYAEHGFSVAAQFNTTVDSTNDRGPIALAKQRLSAVVIDYLARSAH
jgi:D-alanyl-D-alanine carboxypeptidase